MTIEILYPSICNLYGESYNHKLLKMCLPEAEFIYTDMPSIPYFVSNDVDMVYIGAMSEKMQAMVTFSLLPFKTRIEKMIDDGVVILATGNAFEIFTNRIDNVTADKSFSGLGIFDLTTRVDLFDRYNGKILGKFEDTQIVGFKAQFSMVFGDNSGYAFFKADKGIGINKDSVYEGVRRNNFFGTHILGPLLVMNPQFTKYILTLLGSSAAVPHYDELERAYNIRLGEFKSPQVPVGY